MAEDLMLKIQEAIRASLPAHLSDELQRVLREGNEAREGNAKMKAALTEQLAENKRLSERAMAVEADLRKHGELKVREDAVAKRETLAAIGEAKVEMCLKHTEQMKDLVGMVFQNNQFKYQRTTSGHDNVPVPMGSCLQGKSTNSSEEIKTEG